MINAIMEDLASRQLNMSDMDDIMALIKRMNCGVLQSDIDMSDRPQERIIEGLIAEEGISLGIFSRDQLIAYSTLGYAPVAAPATVFFGLSPRVDQRVAALVSCVVDAEFQDVGLHTYFIRQRQRLAVELGYTHICGLTSVYGVSSWSSLLEQDMAIAGLKRTPKSGRYQYFLFGDLHSSFESEDGQIVYVGIDNFDMQINVLEHGFLAVKRVDIGDKMVLRFER